jgi:hypothetical protein
MKDKTLTKKECRFLDNPAHNRWSDLEKKNSIYSKRAMKINFLLQENKPHKMYYYMRKYERETYRGAWEEVFERDLELLTTNLLALRKTYWESIVDTEIDHRFTTLNEN